MGSLNGRINRLEGHMPEVYEEERLRRTRAITRMILDEHTRAGPDLSAAVRRVVEDQYEDLNEESRAYIAEAWTENILSWTRLDWMVNAGREGPPDA